MAEITRKDQERLLISILITAVLHIALFTALHLFLNIRLEIPAYAGPLYLEIGPEFEEEIDTGESIPEEKQENTTVNTGEQDIVKGKEDDSSPLVVKRDDRENKNRDPVQKEPEINPVEDDAEHSLPEVETDDTSAGKEDTIPDKILTETPVPGATPVPYNPALEEDSLAELDKLLEGDSTGKTDSDKDTVKTGKDDSSEAEGGGPIIEWEDNQERDPVATYDPVIPDWVSRQGLRLRVKVSFLLTPDGILTSVRVKESSGYPDVDSRIMDALRKWRFPPVSGTKNVYGEITYFIGLK